MGNISQDRKKLKEIHDVGINRDNKIWADYSFIGEYSTKEKALKVLDEIVHHLEYHYAEVYQMPADEGVEL